MRKEEGRTSGSLGVGCWVMRYTDTRAMYGSCIKNDAIPPVEDLCSRSYR